MISKIKNDLPSSIVVFLVALPLCLGVALASGAPLLAGLISGIIGGIIVGAISGSPSCVSGPAAGLTAVVLSSITQLGSFEVFLSALVIAGALQLIMGLARAGFIANYIPSNIIKGLLAAIGIILIMKQIPHAVGFDRDAEGDFAFLQLDGTNTLSELLLLPRFFSMGSIIISMLSIAVLVFWDLTPMRKIKFFPASLCVVLLGVGLNYLFGVVNPSLSIAQNHLVKLPEVSLSHLSDVLHFPSLAAFANYKVWVVGFTVAVVASIETLLNLEAVDNLDTHKRESPPNRELIAQGFGNMVAGMIGGIPVTSVVVRGSVNVYAGAQSKASTILHGVLLLMSILVLTPFLNTIPLAALAAILLVTGYKLTKISLFKEMYKKGWNQFIPFVVTIVAIVFTDLLIGILIGLAVSIFFILRSNFKNPFILEKQKLHVNETIRLELSTQVSFLNRASIKATLWGIAENSKVIIDASNCDFIDQDIQELISDFKTVVAVEKNIELNIIGLKKEYELTDHVQFVNVLDKKTQENLTPNDIMGILKAGNERFVSGNGIHKYLHQQIDATSTEQYPMAVVLGCIDSRTSPELIFDLGIGDILSTRVAGNIVSPEVIGSLELACSEIRAKLIVVMGHSNCGAVSSAVSNLKKGNIGYVTSKIRPAVHAVLSQHRDRKEWEKEITIQNIKNSVDEIIQNSEILSDMISRREVGIVAAYYDTETGRVSFYQYEMKAMGMELQNI
ncbi:MAG: carbonic anhydrase [Bacteroidetes bacterium]|nr:carbonic anhydrase [Bacteroidota bacterium]